MIVPFVDRLQKVNMQIVTMPVPGQEGITRDNVTVRVDAVVYFKVVDAADAVIRVEDYRFAVAQMAQTSLRSPSLPSPELFAQLQKLLSGPQQQLTEGEKPSAGPSSTSSSESPSESSSEPDRSVPSAPSMAEQSLREQLPPVPEPFDLDAGGSKSGQV